MKQTEVMELLREAAALGRQLHGTKPAALTPEELGACIRASRRVNTIQCLLTDSLYECGHRQTAKTILETVYCGTIVANPELLPGLFPLFAALCGDRPPGVWIGNVDWSVL